MSIDEVSAGEVGRRLTEMTNRLETVVVRFDTTYVRLDLFNQTMRDIEKRIYALESRSEWIIRTVIGFVVLTVIGAVYAFAKTSGKG